MKEGRKRLELDSRRFEVSIESVFGRERGWC